MAYIQELAYGQDCFQASLFYHLCTGTGVHCTGIGSGYHDQSHRRASSQTFDRGEQMMKGNGLLIVAVTLLTLAMMVAPVTAEKWDIEIVDSAGDVGRYPSLALDSGGNPRISYFDDLHNNLKYAAWNGAAWDIEIVDSDDYVGTYSSLALDSDGYPKISYFDDLHNNLKYAAWNGAAWDIETVDSAGDVGEYTSLALDSGGNPRISYYDWSNYDLKYASWNGAAWDIETLDSAGDVGKYPSLALDSEGKPGISYYDSTNDDLKYTQYHDIIPAFSATPVSGTAPLAVTFADETTGAISWAWYFGDGGIASTQNPSHTYTTPGTYTVYLTENEGYCTNTSARVNYITVTETTPTTPPTTPANPPAAPDYTGGGESSDPVSPPPVAGTVNANVGGDSAVSSVTVTGMNVNDVIVTGNQPTGLPDGVPPADPDADPDAFQYIELESARAGSITGATISFEVPVSWLEEHGLTTTDIVMDRFSDGQWTELPTTLNEVENGIAHYSAETPGFSFFSIIPKECGAEERSLLYNCPPCPTCPPCPECYCPDPVTEQTVSPPPGNPSKGLPLTTVLIIAGLTIGLLAGVMRFRRWRERRQNPDLFRRYD